MKYFLVLSWLSLWWPVKQDKDQLFRISGRAQGTTYSISYIHSDSIIEKAEIDSLFRVIDLSLSLYEPRSLINQFNRDGQVKMDEHLQKVVSAALMAWKESGGCFDITVKPLVDLWGFGVKVLRNKPNDTVKNSGDAGITKIDSGKNPTNAAIKNNDSRKIPTQAAIKRALQVTGSQYLLVRNDSLLATRKNVQIDCNGIAQGYSVDVVFNYLLQKGLKNMIVEIGGEVRAIGLNAEGVPWRVGIESPSGITEDWHPIDEVIALDNLSVTTSGSYRKFFIHKGRRYSHIIDPRSGTPVNNGIISVTVVAPDAITADAWDDGFFVMGIDTAFSCLRNYPSFGLRVIYSDSLGNIRDSSSAVFGQLKLKQ